MRKFLRSISPFNNETEMSPVLLIVKKILAFWLCYIAGLFISEALVILLHFAMGKNMLVGDVFDAQTITLIQLYGYIVIIAVVLLYWKLVEKKPLSAMGINKRFGTYFVGAGLAILLLALSVGGILLTGALKYTGVCENINVLMIVLLVGGFIVQSTMEEFLCRGLVLHTLKDNISTPVAVSVSTIMFILPHWSSLFSGEFIYGILGILNLVLISVIFSMLTIRQKSIWGACGLHSIWNVILYSILGLNLSGKDDSSVTVFSIQSVGDNVLNGSVYGIEASIITAVVLGACIVVLGFTGRKSKEREDKKSVCCVGYSK